MTPSLRTTLAVRLITVERPEILAITDTVHAGMVDSLAVALAGGTSSTTMWEHGAHESQARSRSACRLGTGPGVTRRALALVLDWGVEWSQVPILSARQADLRSEQRFQGVCPASAVRSVCDPLPALTSTSRHVTAGTVTPGGHRWPRVAK